MSFSIQDKTVIITGATSSVGHAIATQFSQAGAKVMLADIHKKALVTMTSNLQNDQQHVQYFSGNLREKLAIANLLSATVDHFERIDILINAAHHISSSKPLEPRSDNFETLFKHNVLTNLRLSQAVAKRFILQDETNPERSHISIGTIINLNSTLYDHADPLFLGYSVSCAALKQLTISLASAFKKNRIRVNAISINTVKNSNSDDLLNDDEIAPLEFECDPEEVSKIAQFLASDLSGSITGQTIVLNGG